MTRDEYRAMLVALSDADLLHESAVRRRHSLDYPSDQDSFFLENLAAEECARRDRPDLWDQAKRLATNAGRHGVIPIMKGGE